MAKNLKRITFARDVNYDGKLRKAGSTLAVDPHDARNLIFRGTARVADAVAHKPTADKADDKPATDTAAKPATDK